MKKERYKHIESGVSEAIGYIMILGIMVTGIGLITLYGYPALLEQQASTNVRNMERNMIALQTDINSLTYKSVPYKETTMQISGGTLSVIPPDLGASPNFEITYWNTTAAANATKFFYPGEIRYETDSQSAVVEYENGNVHKRYWSAEGSTTLSNPRWFIDDNAGNTTLVITLIQITTEDTQRLSRNGISTVQMKVDPLPEYSTDQDYGGTEKTVTVVYAPNSEYDYRTAWENYFSGLLGSIDTSESTVKWSFNVNRLVIKSSKITVLSL